jgi:hypothetical protein
MMMRRGHCHCHEQHQHVDEKMRAGISVKRRMMMRKPHHQRYHFLLLFVLLHHHQTHEQQRRTVPVCGQGDAAVPPRHRCQGAGAEARKTSR